ncbi:C1q-related factor-like [Pecten maximus]|uniref:C1q-related factor-like n=1 Tax=Pecten maximus TaxID=6579 RepID=UPI001458BE7E|nr:C1q-related factor-like [Pecten maximus]
MWRPITVAVLLFTFVNGQTPIDDGSGCDVAVLRLEGMLDNLTRRVNELEIQRKEDVAEMSDMRRDLDEAKNNHALILEFGNMTAQILGKRQLENTDDPQPPIQGKGLQERTRPVDETSNIHQEGPIRSQPLNGSISHLTNRVGTVSPPTGATAFYARLGHDLLDVAKEQVIHFETIITNIGGHYNHNSGLFTCSTQGTFAFFWSMYTENPTWIDSELVKNGNAFAFSRAGQSSDNEETSSSAIVNLSPGDMVWLRIKDRSSSAHIIANYTTFSGFEI